MDDFTIRPMSRAEVQIAIDWAADEGWNPGLHDRNSFYAADPGGFLIGLLGQEPVAVISAIRYGHSFGFIGFYIVKPGYRGRGFGLRIWQAAVNTLRGRLIGLDGVIAQQQNYRKSGFSLAYRDIRYAGIARGSFRKGKGIVSLSTIPFVEVYAYDRPFFPDDRQSFLRAWINQPDSYAFGCIHGNMLSGYGVIRHCRNGYKIGPLFADSPEVAEDLFLTLQGSVPKGEALYLDIPEPNSAATSLVKRHAMTPAFETARMYRGPVPALPLERLFGVTSLELG